MTDPVNRVSSTKETGRKNAPIGTYKSERHSRVTDHTDGDKVDISEEAREKASGRKRKSILEYIQD